MARSGIYRSDVENARQALLTQGKHPSIDAVRAALGNTGSKTTIHRYLKEIEQEDGLANKHAPGISEAIQALIEQLAQRLQEEADVNIAAIRQEATQQLAIRDATISQLQQDKQTLQAAQKTTEQACQAEREALQHSKQLQQEAALTITRLSQQISDFDLRLAEQERHRQSLEDKHQHAREALAHYRESVRQQREQEHRQQEQIRQQLQAELRCNKP